MIFKNENSPRPQLSGVQILCPHEMIIPVSRLYLQYNDVIFLLPVALRVLSWLHLSGSWLEIHANQLSAGYWKPGVTDKTNEVSLCLVSRTRILLVPAKALGVWGIWKIQGLSLQMQHPNGSQLKAGSGSAAHVPGTVTSSLGFVEGIFPALFSSSHLKQSNYHLTLWPEALATWSRAITAWEQRHQRIVGRSGGQWSSPPGSLHPPSVGRPRRKRSSPGWVRTADGVAPTPSYPPSYPQKWWQNHFQRNPQACQENKEHSLYTRNHEQS